MEFEVLLKRAKIKYNSQTLVYLIPRYCEFTTLPLHPFLRVRHGNHSLKDLVSRTGSWSWPPSWPHDCAMVESDWNTLGNSIPGYHKIIQVQRCNVEGRWSDYSRRIVSDENMGIGPSYVHLQCVFKKIHSEIIYWKYKTIIIMLMNNVNLTHIIS